MHEGSAEGNNEGSDEYPMTLEDEMRRRALENDLDDGQWQDWSQGPWSSTPATN